MSRFINEVGNRYGRLTVIEPEYKRGKYRWVCKCDCGNIVKVAGISIRNGDTRSCGCLRSELSAQRHLKIETGKRYGRWIVIRYLRRDKNRFAVWLCECDCGNRKEVTGISLRTGRTNSCGCLAREIRSLPEGEAAFNSLYSRYKRWAVKSNRIWEIDRELFRNLVSKSCYYCGQFPNQVEGSDGNNGIFKYNGLDRIDNQIGYIPNNVVSCCKRCNFAKGTMSKSEFVDFICQAYKWLESQKF